MEYVICAILLHRIYYYKTILQITIFVLNHFFLFGQEIIDF